MGAIVWAVTMTAASLDLTVEREGSGGVLGLTPTVALRNAATLGSYFDWADGTFKSSGWATKYASMTEVERGHYRHVLDLTATPTVTQGMALVAEYYVNQGGVVGSDHDVITVMDEESIAAAVWASVVDGTLTAEDSLRIINAILSGKVSGAGTGTEVFRDPADTKNRVIVTVDSVGNRTVVVRDVT